MGRRRDEGDESAVCHDHRADAAQRVPAPHQRIEMVSDGVKTVGAATRGVDYYAL